VLPALHRFIPLCIALILFGNGIRADEDAETAHRLRSAGTILPLEYFLRDARARYPGHLIDVELEYEASHGRYVYEILLLDPWGILWELEYDARSGVLIEREPGGD